MLALELGTRELELGGHAAAVGAGDGAGAVGAASAGLLHTAISCDVDVAPGRGQTRTGGAVGGQLVGESKLWGVTCRCGAWKISGELVRCPQW